MRPTPLNPTPKSRPLVAALAVLAAAGVTLLAGPAPAATVACHPEARAAQAAIDRAQQEQLLATADAGSPARFRLVEERGASNAVLIAVEQWRAAEAAAVGTDPGSPARARAVEAARLACS
jgi:hypothetical protein